MTITRNNYKEYADEIAAILTGDALVMHNQMQLFTDDFSDFSIFDTDEEANSGFETLLVEVNKLFNKKSPEPAPVPKPAPAPKAKPEPKQKKEPKSKREPKPKPEPKTKKAKDPEPEPEPAKHQVEKIPFAVAFINRYRKMQGKMIPLRLRKGDRGININALLASLQKSMIEKVVTKSDKYADELYAIQKKLTRLLKENKGYPKIKVDLDKYPDYMEIVNSYAIKSITSLAKRFIAIQGKEDVKTDAEKLLKAIDKNIEAGTVTKSEAADMHEALTKYIDGKTTSVEVSEQTLNGLHGLAGYKWKPSQAQKKAFAQRMQDPDEKAAYEERKKARNDKRRNSSQFDYNTAGGQYVPTQAQHDFCLNHYDLFKTAEQKNAADMVMYGYSSREKVHHDYIHIINELRREHPELNGVAPRKYTAAKLHKLWELYHSDNYDAYIKFLNKNFNGDLTAVEVTQLNYKKTAGSFVKSLMANGGNQFPVKKTTKRKSRKGATSKKALAGVDTPAQQPEITETFVEVNEIPTPAAEPPKPKVDTKNLPDIISSETLRELEFEKMGFTGKWLKLIGDPVFPFSMMIHAKPGMGKSSLAIEFCYYLATEHDKKILYISKDEGNSSYTMQEKFERLGAFHHNVHLSNGKIPDASKLQEYDFVVFDLMNDFDFDYKDFKFDYIEKYKGHKAPKKIGFISVFKATADGQFRGNKDWENMFDVSISINDEGFAQAGKNRFGAFGVLKYLQSTSEKVYKVSSLIEAEKYRNRVLTKDKIELVIVDGPDGRFWLVSPQYATVLAEQGFNVHSDSIAASAAALNGADNEPRRILTNLPEAITSIAQAKQFLHELDDNNESYDPTLDAHDLQGEPFTYQECEQLNKLMTDIANLPGDFDAYEYVASLSE